MNCSLSGSFVHGICQASILQCSFPFPSLGFPFHFFFSRGQRANLKKSTKYSQWLKVGPSSWGENACGLGCPWLAGLTAQDVGFASCCRWPAVFPGWDKPILGGDLYPVGSRTWGSEEGECGSPRVRPQGSSPPLPSPAYHPPSLRSSPSSLGSKLRLESLETWAQGLHLEQIKNREKSEEF